MMSHDGIARSIHPSHTPMDGDTIFAITTNNENDTIIPNFTKKDLTIMGSYAADCVARSCNRAVYEATSINSKVKSWKDVFGN